MDCALMELFVDLEGYMKGFLRARIKFTPLALIFVILVLGQITQATTVVMLNDEDLAVSSRAIVRGKVAAIESRFDDSHKRIYTYVTIDIKSLLKGNLNNRQIVIRQLGGRVGDYIQLIYGAPEFKVGEKVFLFLNTADDGALRIAHIFMGKFSIVLDPRTYKQKVQRSVSNVQTLNENAELGITNEMELSRYQNKIRAILSSRADRVNEYERLNKSRPMFSVPAEYYNRHTGGSIQPQFNIMGQGFRWFEPDTSSPVLFYSNFANVPISTGGLTELNNSLAAWTNIPNSSITLQNGGSTTACGLASEGITSISFGDCQKQIEDPVSCSGVLALSAITGITGEAKVVNGKSFTRIIEADIVFNNNFECFLSASSNLSEIMTHELGHSIGLAHSSQDSNEIASLKKDATMYFFAHGDGRGASVRSDDIAGASFIYPSPDSSTSDPTTTITGFTPIAGAVGSSVTITGKNLYNPSSVKIGTVIANILSSSDTSVVVMIGTTVTTGKITVTSASGTATSNEIFTVISPPSSISFSTTPYIGGAPIGAVVAINGTNVGSATNVLFNGTPITSPITPVSATSIKVTVPAGATTGKVQVENRAGTALSSAVFKILPAIRSISPLSGIRGESVTITGTSFSNLSSVRFGYVTATVASLSDNQIVVAVPATALTGKITLTTTSGTVVSTQSFTVIRPPTISSISPSPSIGAPIGGIVTISGIDVGFAIDVSFNGVSITSPVTVISPTSIRVIVPSGATKGRIRVVNLAGSVVSYSDFIVK
jgi:hypothetical protein